MAQQASNNTQRSVLDDTYELLSPVGRGSDCIVYRAQFLPYIKTPPFQISGLSPDEQEPREFAIKILTNLAENPEGAIARVQRETEALTASTHTNVIRLYDSKATPDLCYLVFEYAGHGNLQRILDDYAEPLSPERALKLTIQLLNGLEAIHRAGIVHRDIKPENILVTDRSTIKISDFSIALLPAERSQIDGTNHAVGTLEYAAPEFLKSGAVSESSDLYAVGVTLFQFLTKKLPFEGHTLSQQINRKVGGLRNPLPAEVREKHALLESLIDKALAPERIRRFQNVREFRHAAEAVLSALRSPTGSRADLQNSPHPRRPSSHQNLSRAFATPAVISESRSAPLRESTPADSTSATDNGARSAQQLERLRDSRVRTRTDYQELKPFIRHSDRRRRLHSWKQVGIWGCVCATVIAMAIGLKVFDRAPLAVAALGIRSSGESPATQSLRRGIMDFLFARKGSSYARIKPLTSGTHLGVIRNLFSEEEHVPFIVQGLDTGDRMLVSLGIPGWEAKTIVLNPKSRSGEIRIVGHGIDLSLHLSRGEKKGVADANEAHLLRGQYRERLTGRTGSWSLSLQTTS